MPETDTAALIQQLLGQSGGDPRLPAGVGDIRARMMQAIEGYKAPPKVSAPAGVVPTTQDAGSSLQRQMIPLAPPKPLDSGGDLYAQTQRAAGDTNSSIAKIGEMLKPKEDADKSKRERDALIATLLAQSGAPQEVTTTQKAPKVPTDFSGFSTDMREYIRGLTGGLETGADPNAINGATGAAGLFQFQPGTVASLIKSNPQLAAVIDDNWRGDGNQQAALLNAYTTISDNLIKQMTGRMATNPERHVIHFLGHGLGPKALAHPDEPISTFLSEKAWEDHKAKNPGVLKDGITGRDLILRAAPYFKRVE